ncbi:type III-A CRISPR-associated RAMP protein Csm3 [Alicyclobacillaceae bacterium I2511]|nr:type III-A CRISPR-associated RAMP protein Csm3 [Alicyclobacillaceae bacterium I2511]
MTAYAHLYGKIFLSGTMKVITGLHIGALSDSMSIGGIDSPVVRDPVTRYPYIPGSSLKGKLRSLLERTEFTRQRNGNVEQYFSRPGGGNVKHRHECTKPECPVCRMFGATSSKQDEGNNLPARLAVRDLHLTRESAEELKGLETGLYMTEWKSENGLDRLTAAANPRQIERVPAGSEFHFELVYTVTDTTQILDDWQNIIEQLRILEDDALGGHGSRGYGQVQFKCEQLVVRTLDTYRNGDDSALILDDFGEEFPLRSHWDQVAGLFANGFASQHV